MSKLTVVALIAIVLLTPAAADAQYTYDWSTGARAGHEALKAGSPITIQITGLNTLCYQPHVRVTTSDATVDLSGFMDVLKPIAEKAAEERVQAGDLPGGILKGTGVDQNARTNALRILADVEHRLEEAASLRLSAESFTGPLANPCGMGRGWRIDRFATRWRDESQALLNRLSTTHERLHLAEDQLDRVEQVFGSGSHAEVRERIASARELLPRRQREIASALATLTQERPRLDALEHTTQLQTAIRPGQDADRMQIVVQMVPLDTTTRRVIPTDTLDEGLYRRFRVIVSTGAFVTFGPHDEYRRVNRPFVRDSIAPDGSVVPVQTDSTYSTYASQRGGVLDVFSPSVQFNMTFGEVRPGFPALFSFGAAGRSVNGTLIPEPFAGVSIGLNDRLIFSGGAHFGRKEVLLITRPGETAADVEARPVPGTVTPADAVGTRWGVRRYFTVSVRP
jgi:hypothetical protein